MTWTIIKNWKIFLNFCISCWSRAYTITDLSLYFSWIIHAFWLVLMIYWRIDDVTFNKILLFYHIEQIDFMLLWVSTVVDHIRRRSFFRISPKRFGSLGTLHKLRRATTATRRWQDGISNGQNNSLARAF